MEQLLQGLRAAGEETRLRLLVLCGHAELTVSEIIQILGQSQPRVSRHLKLLCDAGLLDRFQEGSWVFYRLAAKGDNAHLARHLVDLTRENDPVIATDLERLDAVRKTRQDVAFAYFRKNASRWNEIRSLHVDEAEVEARLVKLLQDYKQRYSKEITDFLDIGTGTGRILELMNSEVTYAVGVDNSREMLGYARAAIEEKGLRNCQIRQGDMYTLPFGSDSQDVVVIHQVLHYADRPKDVLQEARRVMRPGALMVIVDFAPHSVKSLQEEHAHQQMGFDAKAIERMCSTIGFQNISTETLTGDPLTVNIWSAEAV